MKTIREILISYIDIGINILTGPEAEESREDLIKEIAELLPEMKNFDNVPPVPRAYDIASGYNMCIEEVKKRFGI